MNEQLPAPLRQLSILGGHDQAIALDVFAETEWLAVTRRAAESEDNFKITHKPTGMATGAGFETLDEAVRVMEAAACADIDWNWGQDWARQTRISVKAQLRDPKCAAARDAYRGVLAAIKVGL